MKLNQLSVLCFVLFVIFDGTNSQFFGRQARRRQCTTNQHCSSEKYRKLCSRYRCVVSPNNECNNEADCPGDSECRGGSCQLCSGQRFVPSIGNIEKTMYVSFLLSGQTGSFLAVLKFLQLKLKYATFEGGFFMFSWAKKCKRAELLEIKPQKL